MGSLLEQIVGSSKHLADTLAFVSQLKSGGGSLSSDCYDLWRRRAELHRSLLETRELFPIRDAALAISDAVVGDENLADVEMNRVRFCGQIMTFAAARHLAMATYLTTTWTIYDRLANVCGRLAGIESVGSNPQSHANPNIRDFLFPGNDKARSSMHGFSLNVVFPAYAWPTRISNLIRNWVIHEGLEKQGVALFAGNGFSDGYDLSEDALRELKETAEKEGARSSICRLSAEDGFPWYDKDVRTILRKYDAEIDVLVTSLLQWCVGSFVAQVKAFSEQDRFSLAGPTAE